MGKFTVEELLLRAYANYKIKNYKQMLGFTQQALKERSGFPLALHYKALALLGLGDLKGAENNIVEALQKENTNFSHLFVLGLIYWQTGDHKQAEDSFKKAITYTPNEPTYLVEYATFLIHRGRFEEALDAAYKAKSIDDEAKKLKEVIKSARHKEFSEEIDALTYEPPLPFNEKTAIPYNKLGDYYLKNAYLSNAQYQYSRALHFDPINNEAMQGFATATRLTEGGFYTIANQFAHFILQWYILLTIIGMFGLLGFVAFKEPFFRIPAAAITVGVIVAIVVLCVLGFKPKTAAEYRNILKEWEVDNIDDLIRKMESEQSKKSAVAREEESIQNKADHMARLSTFCAIIAFIFLGAQMLAVNIPTSQLTPDFTDFLTSFKRTLYILIVVGLGLAIYFRVQTTAIRAQMSEGTEAG